MKVGAGIQIPSNSSRLLLSWGVGEYLVDGAIEPQSINFRRWQDGDVISRTRLIPEFQDNFGAPYYVAHRAHLHSALHKRALDLGVLVRTASRVDHVDEETGSLTIVDGTVYHGDLVIAADGMHHLPRALGGPANSQQVSSPLHGTKSLVGSGNHRK